MVNYNENAVREAAYFIWQNAGCPAGRDQEFWTMAVEQLNNCSKSSCKSSAKKSCSSSKNSTTASRKTTAAKKTSSSKKSK